MPADESITKHKSKNKLQNTGIAGVDKNNMPLNTFLEIVDGDNNESVDSD